MGKGIHQPYIRAVGIQVEGSGRIHATFTAEEEQEFISMSRNPDIHQSLLRSIAPSIYGHMGLYFISFFV